MYLAQRGGWKGRPERVLNSSARFRHDALAPMLSQFCGQPRPGFFGSPSFSCRCCQPFFLLTKFVPVYSSWKLSLPRYPVAPHVYFRRVLQKLRCGWYRQSIHRPSFFPHSPKSVGLKLCQFWTYDSPNFQGQEQLGGAPNSIVRQVVPSPEIESH